MTTLRAALRGRSELGVCALLLTVGVLVLTDALTMDSVASVRGPVGPRTVPVLVGGALLVVALVLAVDVLRGPTGPTAPPADEENPAPLAAESGTAEADTAKAATAEDGPAPGPKKTGTAEQPEAGEEPGTSAEAPRADGTSAEGAGVPHDWRTVALLTGVFLAFAALIEPLGFPVAGALLFWGSAYTLGSRTHAFTRDPLIAAVLSVVTYAVFHTLLGVALPGGPLMGVL